jgi:hypothetical protein
MSKIRNSLIQALLSKYEGDMAEAKANIEVYLENPAGIGDHPDVVSAIDMQVANYATANEKWDVVSDKFGEVYDDFMEGEEI